MASKFKPGEVLAGISAVERWKLIQPVIPKLSRPQQALYLYLHGAIEPGRDDVWASIKTLASPEHLNWDNDRYLKQIMSELMALGLVKREPRGDYVSATIMLMPPKRLGGATGSTPKRRTKRGATGSTGNQKGVKPGTPLTKGGATENTVQPGDRSKRLSPKAKTREAEEAELIPSNANARTGGIYQSNVQASDARMRRRPRPRPPAPTHVPARTRENINELDGITLDEDERFAYQHWCDKFDDDRAKDLLRAKRSREAA